MQTRNRIPGAAIYFVTNNQSDKLEDLKFDSHVNCAYIRGNTGEWVSVSGFARIVGDRDMIKQLWTPDCKKWFGDLGDGVHDGSASDPRVCLVRKVETVCCATAASQLTIFFLIDVCRFWWSRILFIIH